jgi:hypothetical protein
VEEVGIHPDSVEDGGWIDRATMPSPQAKQGIKFERQKARIGIKNLTRLYISLSRCLRDDGNVLKRPTTL